MMKSELQEGEGGRGLCGGGIASLTLGSLLRGVLEVYGTTSRLCAVYGLLGWTLLTLGFLSWTLALRRRGRKAPLC